MHELKEFFFSFQTNKILGYEDINFNVIKKYFGEINEYLQHLLNLFLENGIFPEKTKIDKVLPLLKNGDTENVTNYHPMSVLPCFSEVLKRIIYNHRLFKYLCKEKSLYLNKFGLCKGHSRRGGLSLSHFQN